MAVSAMKKTPQSRWQAADENFRKQIRRWMAETGLTKERFAQEAEICYSTFCAKYNRPGSLTVCETRQIASAFERYGLHYDMTMGEAEEAAG